MLRWLQSTVQTSGGYGAMVFRLHVTRKLSSKRISSLGLLEYQASPATGRPACPRAPCATVFSSTSEGTKNVIQTATLCVVARHASNERVRNIDTLRQYLTLPPSKRLSPDTLISLYESVRSSLQPKMLSAAHFSTFISILGASSLPPDAPRIKNHHVDGMPHSSSYWSYVLRVADDKKASGYLLNEGDHYWAMWAWIAQYRSGKDVNALSNASIHYNHIWRKTKFPDILVPYFEALLSAGSSEHLDSAVVDLCGILDVHSNVHGRSLELIWNVFLAFPKTLTLSTKHHMLHALWNRITMSHTEIQRSKYMATHMFNPLTKRHERLPLDITHLVASLGAYLFPFFLVTVPLSVQQWARRQLHAALSPSCSDDVRWANFTLFALNQAARNGLGSRIPTLDLDTVGPHFDDWHVVLTLSILENVVNNHMLSTEGSEIHSILGTLWERWTNIPADDRPVFVSRAVVSSFLRLAARSKDTYILNHCYRYSINRGLWESNPDLTVTDRAQTNALVGHYLEAFILCYGKRWDDVLHFFDVQKGVSTPISHADFVLQKFIPVNIGIAYDFYEYCVSHNIAIGTEITTLLAIILSSIRAHDVFPMLERGLDHLQLEKVLLVLLETLRTQRYHYLTPTSGNILGRVLCKLLQSKAPVARMKYALRYALSLLVSSNCALDAIQMIELLNERVPSFLSSRFLQRLLGIFLRHRQYTSASRLHRVMQNKSVPSQNRFRKKLILGFIRGRATALARRVRSYKSATSTFERITNLVEYRGPNPCRRTSDRVLSIIRKNPSDIPSIKYAFAVLVLSKRPVAAKRLFQSSLPYLDSPTKLWLGNMFLHRILRRFDKRNIQVVKKLLRAKRYLKANFGFGGDRITFNILMKGMLRWKSMSSLKIRMLFDDCIRMGYPVSSRWRRINDVPFGTQTSYAPATFGISTLETHISFRRHVRPLYKMFIKAFYLRKDVEAAKTVVGILKNEEAETLSGQQYRDRSRLEGLAGKRKRR